MNVRKTHCFTPLFITILTVSELFLLSFGFVLTQLGVGGGGGGVASGRYYEIGKTYFYDYTLGVELNEPGQNFSSINFGSSLKSGYRTGSTVGYKILCQVQVTPVWQSEPGTSLLEIQIIKPQLQIKSRKAPTPEGFHEHSSLLNTAQLLPFYAHWKEGAILNVYSLFEDEPSLVNIKKGIANLLQFEQGKTFGSENTPMGTCNVTYSNPDSRNLKKNLSGKCNLGSHNFQESSHPSPALGSTTESSVEVKTQISESLFVEEVTVAETHIVRVNAKKEVGAFIISSQELRITSSSLGNSQIVSAPNLETAIAQFGKTKTETLVPVSENFPICEGTNCKDVKTIVKTMRPENMATTKMSSAFIQTVEKLRTLNKDDIKNILVKNEEIMPQLLDACAATATKTSHEAVKDVLNFNELEDISRPERYLMGLSLATFPDTEIVTDLFDLCKKGVKNEKLRESLILTTAALVHTLRQQGSPEFGVNVENYLVDSLYSEIAKKSQIPYIYLRSLKNLKSPNTINPLFNITQSADSKIGVVAMKALHSMPPSYFNRGSHREILINIIKQLGKKFDSSTRTLAIDIILRDNPTRDEIKELLKILLPRFDPTHSEVSTFLWRRLQERILANAELGKWVDEIVKEEGFNTYHHLSPKGLSTSFSRVFTTSPSANSSFSNSIEMTGKILKRSSFDVYVESQDSFIHPLSLGIFASGLSSFASSDNGEGSNSGVEAEEEEEATAGMELSLMGVQMRPIIFFVGKGELMGLVWSGAGSERTTALQGNILLQNVRKTFPLYNGLVADVNIQGGLSFDLAGQMTISLWHRTANSLVENKAGLLLQSIVRVDTSFVKSRVDYTVASEAKLDFTSDINFYDGVVMCLKLTQPEFNVKQNIHKTERIPGSKHRLRKAKYNTIPIPGVTYALNKKNSELCGVMYKDEL